MYWVSKNGVGFIGHLSTVSSTVPDTINNSVNVCYTNEVMDKEMFMHYSNEASS